MESNSDITRKSLPQKIKCFFIRPSELFAEYREKPAWALKLLVISLVMALYTYATRILGKDLFIEMMEEQAASLPPDQAEAVRASIPFMSSPMMDWISAGAGALTVIAIILIVSFVYKLFIKGMKGNIKYSQTVAIYTTAYMASTIGLLAKLAFMYITGNLLYIDLKPTFTSALFNCLDPFYIWQAILMVFGISVVSGLPEKKGTIIVVVMWLLALAFSMGSVLLAK